MARHDRVDRDAVQPGRKGAARFEARQCAPGADEGLLYTILGGLAVSGQAHAQGMHASGMEPVEPLKSRPAATGGSGYGLALFDDGARGGIRKIDRGR
jgi:hypothetical protein